MIKEYLGTISNEEISSIEEKYNICIPQDYKEFLVENNGAIATEDTRIDIEILNNYIEMDALFGIGMEQKWLNLCYWMDEYADELPENTVIIGTDILGGLIVLIADGENTGVYYWDTALNFEASNEGSNAYYMFGSFNEFFEHVKE